MFSPESRTVAIELLRPPAGYRLDCALLTTYSLDLEALLALPLAVLAHADGGVEELLADPLLLLEALREAGERVHVFVDQAGIAIPHSARALYAMLEKSVHPVKAPNGGAFHPKVWVARFESEDEDPLLRVAVLSRNLTFDRAWDVALASEASPSERRRPVASRPLGALLRALPDLTTQPLPVSIASTIRDLAEECAMTHFPGPEGFEEPVRFHGLGLKEGRQRPWMPQADGIRLLAIAPFVNRTALDGVWEMSDGEHVLVSRQEELDRLPANALEDWDQVLVLSDVAQGEIEDAAHQCPSGLHAKILAIEHGWNVTWYVGSANLTAAAYTGTNVELMASITGSKGRKNSDRGFGIERFRDAGFMALCSPYTRSEADRERAEAVEAQQRLESARDQLVAADLRVVCAPDGDTWAWQLEGDVELPNGIEASHWPVSLPPEQARPLALPNVWTLPMSRLTAFVALELRVATPEVEDIRLTLKLPAQGLPEGRVAQVLRTLIDSPERFLRFLRALLGGLEGMADWATGEGDGGEASPWGEWLGGEKLLEDLIRVASRDPARLEPVRRLIHDLRDTEEGREIVPDDLLEIWNAVDEAIDAGGHR